MAYNQKNNAGRGNLAKTGAGVPSALTMTDPKLPKSEVKKQKFDKTENLSKAFSRAIIHVTQTLSHLKGTDIS